MRRFSQTKGCWVDVFDHPVFVGRRRRLRGPTHSPICIADKNQWIGSMIVGPGAEATLQWQEGGHPNRLPLKPKQIVADVKKLRISRETLELAILASVKDNCSELPTTKRRGIRRQIVSGRR
ncbi:MAG TPA: hypothetical protein VHX86_10880 [Tepidisphaeraceae bacterium]|jgi:hypothetical protein|nr:hypothetical protein [Tepidisphaeraceae bacterium]